MERALNAELLNDALGIHAKLPTPNELGNLLARAEIDLFFGAETEHERLLVSAWYLHAIAAARRDDVDALRRAQAGRVSAHIFDVYLQGSTEHTTMSERLRSVVAAQFGYVIGELAPNAIALGTQAGAEVPAIAADPGRLIAGASGPHWTSGSDKPTRSTRCGTTSRFPRWRLRSPSSTASNTCTATSRPAKLPPSLRLEPPLTPLYRRRVDRRTPTPGGSLPSCPTLGTTYRGHPCSPSFRPISTRRPSPWFGPTRPS